MNRTLRTLTSGAMVLLAITQNAIAETAAPTTTDAAAGATTAVAVAPPQSTGSVIGSLDMRPSWTTAAGKFHMENALEAGYKFSSTAKATANFAFNNNLYDPTQVGQSLNATAETMFVRASFSNIADLGSGISLSYQPRVYIPVKTSDIAAGHITSIRNYFTFTKKFSPTFSLSLSEIPIVRIFRTAGFVGASGATANPAFENRVYLTGNISFTEKLSLAFPIMFHTTFHRDFAAGAAKNSATTFYMWIYPELAYAATNNLTVGLSFYSDNLVAPDLSAVTIGKGLGAGIAQFFVTASL